MAIDPDEKAINALLEIEDGKPIILMNLLRFTEGGEATYEEYVRHCKKHAISLDAAAVAEEKAAETFGKQAKATGETAAKSN